jgi:anti-sigma factor RsiW
MLCEKVRELLVSDYLDAEATPEAQARIKEHLLGCGECRSLEKQLLAQRALFQQVKPLEVPDRVWQNIRVAVEAEEASRFGLGRIRLLLERLKEVLFPSRPAVAFAGAFAVILVVAVLSGTAIIRIQQNAVLVNAGQAFSDYSLIPDSDDTGGDLGTDMERYFL